jgi:hypothetical protein
MERGGSTAGIASVTLTISGVTNKNTNNFLQAISVSHNGGAAAIQREYAVPNTGNYTLQKESSSTSLLSFSGDVELESKPDWADADASLIYCVKTAEDSAASNSIWQTIGDLIQPVNSSKTVEITNLNVTGNLTVEGRRVGSPRITTARAHTSNGYGSSNTKIPKFSTDVELSDGVVVTTNFTDAVNGSYIIANMDCLISISWSGSWSTTANVGLSLNSDQLTTNLIDIDTEDILNYEACSSTMATQIAITYKASAGDVIRPHNAGEGTSLATGHSIYVLAEEIIE